jgi:hypothetical protein
MTLTTRKLAIALAVSVALNLFVLGFGAARMLGRDGRMHEPRAEQQFRDRGEWGPRGPGPHMFDMMGPRSGAMREHVNALRQAQRAVATALTADPFERPALEAALAQLRQRQSAAAEASHAALCDLAQKLDKPGRHALVERGRFPHMH